ncbi:MAG: hypothetical protein MJZ08_05670, partial [Bacteroidaceae bacterium]|nr:hypothetical protein [Bacteroidaceae bacterium]
LFLQTFYINLHLLLDSTIQQNSLVRREKDEKTFANSKKECNFAAAKIKPSSRRTYLLIKKTFL